MNKHYISAMCRKVPGKQSAGLLKKQKGSALIIAVFIIIVISLLGASLASLQRDSAEGTSYEVYAARAYLAAYSAGEIALAQLFPLGSEAADATNCTEDGQDLIKQTVTLASGDSSVGFHGCMAEYTCEQITDAISTRYKVVSTAICKNAQINTRRQITVEASSL